MGVYSAPQTVHNTPPTKVCGRIRMLCAGLHGDHTDVTYQLSVWGSRLRYYFMLPVMETALHGFDTAACLLLVVVVPTS